jgi:hypothetical protein
MLLYECQLSDLDKPGMYPGVIDHAGLNGAIKIVRFRAAAALVGVTRHQPGWVQGLGCESHLETARFVISTLKLVGASVGVELKCVVGGVVCMYKRVGHAGRRRSSSGFRFLHQISPDSDSAWSI